MWGWLGPGRWVPAGAAYPPEGTVGAAVRTWREAVGRGAAGLHWPAEAEAQAPPCASRSEGRCCRTKTKRVEDLGVSLLDLQLVMGIGRWGMLGRLGGDMGQTISPSPLQEEGTARAGAGERLAALAPEDWAGGWAQVHTQPLGLWPAPSPQPRKLGKQQKQNRAVREKRMSLGPKG